MQVSNNKVVTFHYCLYNESAELLESSKDSNPTSFLVGHGNILPGLEQKMLGKNAGDKLEVTLEPYEAYGVRSDQQQRVSAKYLKHEGKLKPGQVVRLNSDHGTKIGTVIKVGKFSVDVDFNHPLAGQRVRFDIEITKVRNAAAEEIAHGHAHGVGGHQH